MRNSLERFEKASSRFLSEALSSMEGGEQLLFIMLPRLRKVLAQVFEGVLLPASALLGKDNSIPGSLVQSLRDLCSQGIYLVLIEDVRGLAAQLEIPDAKRFHVLSPTDAESATDELAEGLLGLMAEHGYHVERVLIVCAPGDDILKQTLRRIADRILPVFACDYRKRDALESRFPIVNDDAEPLAGVNAIEKLLGSLVFAPRINVSPTAKIVAHGEEDWGILDSLDRVQDRAQQNLDLSLERLYASFPTLRDLNVFDHRSGAVFFSPTEWRHLERKVRGPCAVIKDYFREKLVGYWQPDRPCFRRLLYTPTKVLLRGEEYYVHMKNISPIDRIRAMLAELGAIQVLGTKPQEALEDSTISDPSRWKLCLAFLDQLRNIALQLLSFAHAAEVILKESESSPGVNTDRTIGIGERIKRLYGHDEEPQLHRFVGRAVGSYYCWLLGERQSAVALLDAALESVALIVSELRAVCGELEEWFAQEHLEVEALPIGDLVRRWREADHPGENLLVALEAVDGAAEAESVEAVGVGWGGIELPLLFRHLAKLQEIPAAKAQKLTTYVAKWSHYRGSRKSREEVGWIPFPKYDDAAPMFGAELSILFDDNVLSGITLERVRDEMLLNGAKDVQIFVTRFSGERRWAHMQMEDHGVIDPDFMLERVCGYIGETAFARSWSTKKGDYKSRIGVFSLARRRILECIHNNSTVEAWDREGF